MAHGVQYNDRWYGDTHCTVLYQLKIVPELVDGVRKAHMEIALLDQHSYCWKDGLVGSLPSWVVQVFVGIVTYKVEEGFNAALEGMKDRSLGTVVGDGHYCFGGPHAALLFAPPIGDMDAQSFSACYGHLPQ